MARIKQKTNIEEILDIPDLMDIQKKSYKEFLMYDVPADKRKNQGLQDVFSSVFPISDYNGIYTLQFVGYEFGKPKHEVEEAIERGESFSSPLKGIFRLAINEKNEKTGQMDLKEAPEQAVHLCDIPLMTDRGTFVINGAERVIVSQLHRSPGVSFEEEEETELNTKEISKKTNECQSHDDDHNDDDDYGTKKLKFNNRNNHKLSNQNTTLSLNNNNIEIEVNKNKLPGKNKTKNIFYF
ncbi:MAG TPA: hypothetical protein PKZ78_11915, partial [Candidatus Goldiibacteriota bacterium]|nr:hypothetical protein [Candidatus Goldiibacteriota bacterium]